MRMSQKATAALWQALTFHSLSHEALAGESDMVRYRMYERWTNEALAAAGLPGLEALRDAADAERNKAKARRTKAERVPMAELVAAVRAHAIASYGRDGWDYVIEAWGNADIEEAIGAARTKAGAISAVKRALAPLAGYRAEVIAMREW